MRERAPDPHLSALVELALTEDLGSGGDLSGSLLPRRSVELTLVARQPGVLAGTNVCGMVLERCAALLEAPTPTLDWLALDGARLEPGQIIARLAGPNHVLLAAERTLLNFLTHLSGVATATARAVDELDGTHTILRDTRKTTPGLRTLEKAAVRAGGGTNHRLRLDDAVLLKDNHLAMAPMAELVSEARRRWPGMPLEVEVDTLSQLDEALELGVRLILLDNFDLEDLTKAVAQARGRAQLEASGGLRPGGLRAVAVTGVDFIAVGWITHSAPSLDIGLDWSGS
jgi:nicotinate-nucleotide pyrophosphorylase (carboxylating)